MNIKRKYKNIEILSKEKKLYEYANAFKTAQADIQQRAKDSYSNGKLSLGYGTSDPLNSTTYTNSSNITYNFNLINAIEREQPIMRKVVDYKTGALLKGVDIISLNIDAERIKILENALEDLYPSMYRTYYQSLFYGGGAGLLLFENDNEMTLTTPLNFKKIKKGSFRGIKPLERWLTITPDTTELIDMFDEDVRAEDLGKPKYYYVSLSGNTEKRYKVHYSRLLLFNTGVISYVDTRMQQFWGISEVERLWDALNRYNTAINAVINMFLISAMRIVKTDCSAETSQLADMALNNIKQKAKIMAESLTFSNILWLDKEDEFEYASVNLSNVAEVLNAIREDFVASAEVDFGVIFPDGYNSSQQTENSHDFVKNFQKLFVREHYIKLIKILFRDKFGEQCPEFTLEFKKIRENSDKDMADIISKTTTSIIEVFKAGGMDVHTFVRALSEVKNNPGDVFNNFDEHFIEEYGNRTYNDNQIELARALNKGADSSVREKQGGENNEKKPTPRVKVGE